MILRRPAAERGHALHGWLDSWHSFSFADYHDPRHMGFGVLRVINEDRVLPGMGFGTHGHRDMEIVSYVLSGRLEHKDSLGNGSVIVPGEIQRMSAGRGVMHSERNPSATDPVHFLQIWIEPARRGIDPGYEQKRIEPTDLRGRLATIASPTGGEGAVALAQEARILAGRFDGVESARYDAGSGRRLYVHLARGALAVNGERLTAGDALGFDATTVLDLDAGNEAEVLVFDLPQ